MQAIPTLAEQLRKKNIPLEENAPLAHYTTFAIGGPARLLIAPENEQQLISALDGADALGVPVLLLGRGSNVLMPDEGVPGAVIRTGALNQVAVAETALIAACGASLSEMCRAAFRAALGGLEFAYGIPGVLGGAIYMNAGAYGGEMADVVRQVRLYDREQKTILTLDRADMGFAHRRSRVQGEPELVILGATLALTPDDPAAIRAKMEDYMARRRDKQPLEYPSAGSVFKRPAGAFAGALIEQSGLKGYAIGGAMVSPKHAGFIVNTGGATAAEVCRLIEHIRETVLRDHGVELEPEVQIYRGHLGR